ncbi:heparin lyase I family protein [Agaribacter flavus]|uniref:Heparin lyase I family protein n=1 Tax=Agaribacter flavus TaxID=1902781 RepID=A0ABV7FWQ3_9ALTE
MSINKQRLATICFSLFFSSPLLSKTTVITEDFEDHQYNWSYQLHPRGISIIDEPSSNNKNKVALFELTGEDYFNWKGNPGLNRCELQFKPNETSSNSQTFFNWRFKIPDYLSDEEYQIAYAESDTSYKQAFRLQVKARYLELYSTAENKLLWRSNINLNRDWYDISLEILWHEEKGRLSLSINNKPVFSGYTITKIEKENMFFQVGLLRKNESSVAKMFLDDLSIITTL